LVATPERGFVKGIVLAGGAGSRLDPMTRVASKQLQPVYDKPMIYYPLATLMDAGIREILLISTPVDVPRFAELLGSGTTSVLSIDYAVQESRGASPTLFGGLGVHRRRPGDADPRRQHLPRQHGLQEVVSFRWRVQSSSATRCATPSATGSWSSTMRGGSLSLEEKPARPRSNRHPGLYVYDENVVDIAGSMAPSARGELEITDVNKVYLDKGRLQVSLFDRGVAWLDSGTHDSLLDAANFIATVEHRQSIKIACIEEIALEMGFISPAQFRDLVASLPNSTYTHYLQRLIDDEF
jgi:glucose-1-phosphate thymidylyltransferase